MKGVQVLDEVDDVIAESSQHVVVTETKTVFDEEIAKLLQNVLRTFLCNMTGPSKSLCHHQNIHKQTTCSIFRDGCSLDSFIFHLCMYNVNTSLYL